MVTIYQTSVRKRSVSYVMLIVVVPYEKAIEFSCTILIISKLKSKATVTRKYSHEYKTDYINSFAPDKSGSNFDECIFQTSISNWYLEHYLWNWSGVSATEPDWL